MRKKIFSLLVGALVLAAAMPALAGKFVLDKSHSSVGFAVRHMMVSKTRGSFGDFEGWFVYEAGNPQAWRAEATIQVASVDTGNDDRDNHLRSGDFFDAENFPTLTFVVTGVEMEDETEGKLVGDLTLHGVTKSVELELEFLGTVQDPWGNTRAGFTAEADIDRKDFGLVWNKTMDNGGLVVGDKVEIVLEVEGILEK